MNSSVFWNNFNNFDNICCSDLEESVSFDENAENLDRSSLTSFGSGNTTDSDNIKVSHIFNLLWIHMI